MTESIFCIFSLNIYAGGKTDPNYCVIKFDTKRTSLWIDDETAEFVIIGQ